jgi:aminopeptidase N
VTCKTFDDAWLNEGFATYCEALVHERFEGRAAYIANLASDRAAEVTVTRGKMKIDTLPIYAAATANHHQSNYPATIYKKGAVVLGMLRSYLGDAFFFQALRTYGRNHAYGNVTTDDLERTIESMSGQNLSWFFRQFIYDRGAPVVDVAYKMSGSHLTMDLTQVQDSLGFRYFRMPLFVKTAKTASEYQAIWLDSVKTTHVELDVTSPADTVVIDPDRTALIATRFVSPVAAVDHADRQNVGMNLVPNPASNAISVEAWSDLDRTWSRIDLFDSRGAWCVGEHLDTTAQRVKRMVDVHSLASGAYSVVLSTTDGQQFVERLVVR